MENKEIEILIKKVHPNAEIPTYAHEGDVGMDLKVTEVEYDEKNDMYIYHTGLAFESDFNIGQYVFMRSSNRKTDAYLCNHVGIVDTAIYRGEVLVCMKNRDSIETMSELNALKSYLETFSNDIQNDNTISLQDATECAVFNYKKIKEEYKERAKNLEFAPYKVGDKIAQIVMFNYPNVRIKEVEELSDTIRGANGFGSTGN